MLFYLSKFRIKKKQQQLNNFKMTIDCRKQGFGKDC